ncbi:hypothetical protein ACQR16_23450 [Bradyrhizobium oligotrophicum]|uniref:hypothetical protein n=1 Tax=Bradyrhizobium oligotrophicum TaxID=44255 RepID=UPI003EC0684A
MTTISREALYDLVWTEPVRAIAQRMGVSDVWLKKCCAKADIPVPDRGYWAKLRADKKVIRQKLPPRSPGMATDVTIGSGPRSYLWPPNPEAVLAAPPPTEPTFAESIEAVAVRVDQSLGKIRFVRDLGSAHSLIRHLLDEDALRRLKPSDAPYRLRYSEPLFDSPFERRRLRILNNLFLALIKARHQPWLGEQARNVGVTVGSQKISFTLDHPRARAQASGRIQTPHEAYETLRLEIPATGDSWADDDSGRIEDRLREIILKLIVAGEIQYRANAHAVYENACRRRAEMERRLAEQRDEADRLAREKVIKAEAEQRKMLLRMAADHRAAQDIRAFVAAAITAFGSEKAEESPVAGWTAWALGVADQIDPVRRLQITEDGTSIEKPAAAPETEPESQRR